MRCTLGTVCVLAILSGARGFWTDLIGGGGGGTVNSPEVDDAPDPQSGLADDDSHSLGSSYFGGGRNKLDERLGDDWVQNENDTDGDLDYRFKRALGTSLSAATLEMEEVASQSKGADQVDIGDSFTFSVVLDLPHVTQKSDLTVEVFGMDPDYGAAGFHMCQAHMRVIGSNVQAVQDWPVFTDEHPDDDLYPTINTKTKMVLEQLSTLDEDGDSLNKLEIQFQAVLVDTPTTEYSLLNNHKYYITAGVEYGEDAYVWVGQAAITTVLAGETYDSVVSFNGNPPGTIEKGSGEMFVIDAFITEPQTGLEFMVFQPLGYNDIFHIGHVTRNVGNSFACSPVEKWTDRYNLSPSKLTVNNVSMSYPLLVNRDATRDPTNVHSKIQFRVPVGVVNVDAIDEGTVRMLHFGVKVGTKLLWSALHEITIGPSVAAPSTPEVPNSVTSVLLNDAKEILAGNGIVFKVTVNIKAQVWTNFNVVLTGNEAEGLTAVGCRVAHGGGVAYFPPDWSVTAKDGDNLLITFGTVKNADTLASDVVLHVTFATDAGAPGREVTFDTGTFTVGGQDMNLPAVTIVKNVEPESMDVTADDMFDTNLRVHGQAAIELKATLPPGAGAENLVFESVPDFDITTYSVRLCQIQIRQVGSALPCIYHADTKSRVELGKSMSTFEFNNYGSIDIGRMCPMTYPMAKSGANQFVARAVFELPPQDGIPATDTYQISSGLRLGEETIWVSSREYDVDAKKSYEFTHESSIDPGNYSIMVPFVTAYPVITMRGRNGAGFRENELLFMQYIVKLQPQTRGDYDFKISFPGSNNNLKICAVKITHIGENMPCTSVPGKEVTGRENVEVIYADGVVADERGCGKPAAVRFKGLTNWGTDPIVTDLTPDQDSIQLLVFFKGCAITAGSPEVIEHTLSDYQTGAGTKISSTTGSMDIPVDAAPNNPTTTVSITGTTYEFVTLPSDKIYRHAAKRLKLFVTVPADYVGSLHVHLFNADYGSGLPLDLCDMTVLEAGENLPCINLLTDVTLGHGPHDIKNGINITQSIYATISGVCHITYSKAPEANIITLEAAFRIGKDVPDGTSVSLTVAVVPAGGDAFAEVITIPPLKVATPEEGDVLTTPVNPTEVKVTNTMDASNLGNSNRTTLTVGQPEWVDFYVWLPMDKTVQMEASVLVPSRDGVALFHITDINFGESLGKNILCTRQGTDLRSNYDTFFEQTANLTTFMQMDSVMVDLGYVSNVGTTWKQGIYRETDDQFAIRVELQMADHVLNVDAAVHEILFAVKFEDVIVVAEQPVVIQRLPADRPAEVAHIKVVAEQTSPEKVFKVNEHVNIFLTEFEHAPDSKAESYPGRLRVFLPDYMSYTLSDYFGTNYTLQHDLGVEVTPNPNPYTTGVTHGGSFDFEFPNGITFPDIINFNFSLTVDPLERRPVGSGEETSIVVISPICQVNDIGNPPTTLMRQCGAPTFVPIKSLASECYESIVIADPCQIGASSTLNSLSSQQQSIKPDECPGPTCKVWSPAIRGGDEWEHHVDFDFRTVARLNKVKIGTPAGFRSVERVRVLSAQVQGYFALVIEANLRDNLVEFTRPVEARYLRIVPVGVTSGDEDVMPIGVNGIEWIGCLPAGHVPQTCTLPVPPEASATNYRQFAVDDTLDIVYFCDRNPKKPGLFCYTSRFVEGSEWHQLPSFVHELVGFSPSTKQMYLKDVNQALYSSDNGQRLVLLDPAPSLPPDLESAISVPGTDRAAIGTKAWTGKNTQITADFDGIKNGAITLAQWKSCC